jgi:hypothetical protein
VMALDADEFIRRFLLHVRSRRLRPHPSLRLPRQPHPPRKARALPRPARPVPPPPASPSESVRALMLRLTGIDIERCPRCPQGRLRLTEILAPMVPPPSGRPARGHVVTGACWLRARRADPPPGSCTPRLPRRACRSRLTLAYGAAAAADAPPLARTFRWPTRPSPLKHLPSRARPV